MPTFPPIKDPAALPALTLAYVGDAVFELYVRRMLLAESRNAQRLNDMARELVNHRFQAALYDVVVEDLEEQDAAVLRRGRNAKGQVPRHGDARAYRKATAIEALVGYYYLQDRREALHALLGHIRELSTEGGGYESR